MDQILDLVYIQSKLVCPSGSISKVRNDVFGGGKKDQQAKCDS
jgi:hypothetical protein